VKFLVSKESLDSYVERNQIEPSNHVDADSSVIQNPLLRAQADQTAAAQAQGEDFLIFPFDSIMPQEVNDLFYRMNAAVFTGQEEPQSAVDKLQQAYEDWKEQQI
jgi:raffinose/stachyose/melibiose transport system substrate-binding protein